MRLWGLVKKLSQPLDANEDEFCFWVGEVELRKLESDAEKILSDLSYQFRNQYGTIAADSLIYFRLTGDILIEVVCKNYKIFEQVM